MKQLTYLLALLLINTLSAQKVCETPQEQTIEDLNSITKCTINPSKNSKDT